MQTIDRGEHGKEKCPYCSSLNVYFKGDYDGETISSVEIWFCKDCEKQSYS